MKLTQKAVAALKPPVDKAEEIHIDDDIPGFGVRLRKGGSATWIFQYRVGAKQRRISFGRLSAVSAARARELAGENYAKVRLGGDPAGDKVEDRQRAVETMGAVLENYLAQPGRWRERSLEETTRHLRQLSRPLHGLRIDKIDRRAIATCLDTVTRRNGATTSNRVRASLHAFYAWAIKRGIADSNPVAGTERNEETSRERVLSAAELVAIWAATADASDYSAVVRLLMLSGQRASEIAGLKWSEIVGDTIVLPPERTKNGKKHVIPITEPMRVILEGRPRREGRDLIFGRRWNRPLTGWGPLKAKLDQRLGSAVTGWVHHDLRRTVVTRMAGKLRVMPHIIEAVVNHVGGHKAGVAGVYNRADYPEQTRQALTAWGDHLLAIVEGRPAPEKVVQLRA